MLEVEGITHRTPEKGERPGGIVSRMTWKA